MKKFLIYSLVISMSALGFNACSDDDDDDVTPQYNTPAPGSGGGAGTGGGTGSGGIPPNSMKVTVDGNVIEFDSVSGSIQGNDIEILGLVNNDFNRLELRLTDSLSADSVFFPAQPAGVDLIYQTDSNTTYGASSGFIALRTIDTSRSLVNGRFEVIMRNLNDATDSLVFTKGQFNKFYN